MMSGAALLSELLSGRTSNADERAVLSLLREADRDELNDLLTGVSGTELFRSVDGAEREALIRLLGRERRADLDALATAHIVHGMQSVRRTRLRDEVLVELLTARRGTDLTILKNRINTAEDHQDLEDLVFVDLPASARERVLRHITAEAAAAEVADVKILCDIDDTVFCKLHDRRWPRGMIYPGVLALLEALDLGPSATPFDRGDLTFVTARPADAWGLVENHSRTALRRAGVSKLSVLSGTLLALLSTEAMAERKLHNIEHYRQLFPEYDLVFLGDSGQGDVIVGQDLFARYGEAVRMVLIHDVAGTNALERKEYAEMGIHFHDTYIGAAVIAYRHELITRESLAKVAAEAVGGFAHVRWESTTQRDRIRDYFERDLGEVEEILSQP